MGLVEEALETLERIPLNYPGFQDELVNFIEKA